MKKTLYFASILFLGFAHPAKAAGTNGWVSLGLGISIVDGSVAEGSVERPSTDIASGAATTTPVDFDFDFESEPGIAFNIDAGVAIIDIFRLGGYVAYSTVLEKDFTVDATAPTSTTSATTATTLKVKNFTLVSVGVFTGVQFELGSGTATRHYLYADYGIGWQYQAGKVSGIESYKLSGISHMARVGADVPHLIGNMGAGLELMWTFPQTSPRVQSFSILAKTSYRF